MQDEEIGAEITAEIRNLLLSIGIESAFSAVPLRGGGNNRVYLLKTPDETFLLKKYYQDAPNGRDRLTSEFLFSSFAWENGVRSLPRPVARCDKQPVALYEYIDGFALEQGEIDETKVGEAASFFRALNKHRNRSASYGLPCAAEAFFSIEGHLDCVRKRIASLRSMDVSSPLDAEAKRFAEGDLTAHWEEILETVNRGAAERGVDAAQELPAEDRCISPSDFGFHNAIQAKSDGKLRFFDFEYAGWDDPAKTVCDFFCQPGVPVPLDYYEQFSAVAADMFADRDFHKWRFRLLYPVYQLKWCCIILNVFLPPGSLRRQFATKCSEMAGHKRLQLDKAKNALKRIQPGRSF